MAQPPAEPSSDETIIDAVLGGAVDRYAELVARYREPAWRLAYGFVGHAEDAKELSQNAFVKAYRHLAAFRRQAKFSTWLYRIVANECKDFLRRRARQPRTVSLTPEDPEEPMFEVADDAPDPSQALGNRELARRLSAGIRQLSGQQREAFVLHHLQGLSMDEAAAVMRCRVGTVKVHVFRACGRLRQWMDPSRGT
jgi:RNA polymerase sigma-70 factor (ECF subfamily)